MKLLVGRLVLGCIFAVLVVAEESFEETEDSTTELTTTMYDETSEPEQKTKIFAKPEQENDNELHHEIYVIPDRSSGHHHHYTTEAPHHHHHPPPHHHHHPPPPPPPHHHHYPPYYPPYYPPPYPYGAPVYAPVPQPYPYYPHPQYPPPTAHIKPITVVQTENESNGGHNFVKPGELIHQGTGYLWNLIDQKNNELWNLFANKHGNNGGGDKDENVVHEVVVNYEKPGYGSTIGVVEQPSGGNWYNKGKNIAANDCNTHYNENK